MLLTLDISMVKLNIVIILQAILKVQYEEKERHLKTTFKQGLKWYWEKNIQPKSFAGGKMYQSDSKQTNFPFNFCLFDNEEGPYDVTLTDTLKYRSNVLNLFRR